MGIIKTGTAADEIEVLSKAGKIIPWTSTGVEQSPDVSAYFAHSGRLTVAAAADGATGGRLWLFNPTTSNRNLRILRILMRQGPVAVTVFASSPRVTLERMSSTTDPTGATITSAKRKTADANSQGTVRTAATGMTITAGAIVKAGLIGPVLTGVGVGIPVDQELYEYKRGTSELLLVTGEGIVIRQADAGTASDTRIFIVDIVWEEIVP